MDRPNEQTVQTLHQALRAAMLAGVPLNLGHSPLGEQPSSIRMPSGMLTRAKLGQLETAMRESPNTWPSRYLAAYSLYSKTGRSDLVLEGLSVDSLSRRELAKAIRPTLVYLLVIALMAAFGLGLFALLGSLIIDDMRADLELLTEPSRYAITPLTTAQVRVVAAVVLPLLILSLGLSLTNRVASRLAALFGGRGYLVARSALVLARIEQALVVAGVSNEQARRVAESLLGSKHSAFQRGPFLDRGRTGDVAPSLLALIARHYQDRSNRRLKQLRIALPLLLVGLVGGLGVLVYSLILFTPLVALLQDLAVPSTGMRP